VRALARVFPQGLYPFPVEEIRARWQAEMADADIVACVIESVDGAVAGFAATRGVELLHRPGARPQPGPDQPRPRW
jgi:hypothetical protein